MSHQSLQKLQDGVVRPLAVSANLAAIIVSRVSGEPFAEFTRKCIFEPLGMSRTSWRDDYTRIVRDRAMAYSDRAGVFSTLMPFENVHGNGGLLPTVGESPLYADAFDSPIGVVIFRRDARRRVTAFSVVQDRAWDVRFERVMPPAPSR